MKYSYLVGCTSIAEVNSRTLRIKESSFKEEREPFTKEYLSLLKEHWNAVVHENYFPLSGVEYKPTISITNIPSTHIIDGGKVRSGIVRSLYKKVIDSGAKESSLYFKYLRAMEETGTRPRKEDLELIAELCGYSKGWVHYKELELKLK